MKRARRSRPKTKTTREPVILEPAADVVADPEGFVDRVADLLLDAIDEGRRKRGLPPLR